MELHFIITVSAVVEGWTASGSHELCSLASACLKIYNMFITSSLSWYHKQVNNCYSKDNNKPKYLSTKYGGKWAVIAVQCACNTAIRTGSVEIYCVSELQEVVSTEFQLKL